MFLVVLASGRKGEGKLTLDQQAWRDCVILSMKPGDGYDFVRNTNTTGFWSLYGLKKYQTYRIYETAQFIIYYTATLLTQLKNICAHYLLIYISYSLQHIN